ncbi:uncharacterized protein PHA67_012653 isoform 2-T3 [Liasis olivaceus]
MRVASFGLRREARNAFLSTRETGLTREKARHADQMRRRGWKLRAPRIAASRWMPSGVSRTPLLSRRDASCAHIDERSEQTRFPSMGRWDWKSAWRASQRLGGKSEELRPSEKEPDSCGRKATTLFI